MKIETCFPFLACPLQLPVLLVLRQMVLEPWYKNRLKNYFEVLASYPFTLFTHSPPTLPSSYCASKGCSVSNSFSFFPFRCFKCILFLFQVMEWFLTPERVGYYVAIRVVRGTITPLVLPPVPFFVQDRCWDAMRA